MAKLISGVAMTAAQRQQRRRDKLGALRPPPAPRIDELLARSPEDIAARIMMSVPPEKADGIVAALNQQLVHWRVGTFDERRPTRLRVRRDAMRPLPFGPSIGTQGNRSGQYDCSFHARWANVRYLVSDVLGPGPGPRKDLQMLRDRRRLTTVSLFSVNANADSTTFVLKIVSTRRKAAGDTVELNSSDGSVLTLERGEYTCSED